MARINKPASEFPPGTILTHEGAPAKRITKEQQLRRSVMACMLWEDSFYESGVSIAKRIQDLVKENDPAVVAKMAIDARSSMKLRHVPLLLMRELARHPSRFKGYATALAEVIQRADELTEFLAIYWKDKKQPLTAQIKKGLAQAFTKFSAYDLAKYNRDEVIKLRDVLFLCHAKPLNQEQAETWKLLINDTLPIPDTWEVALSGGKDKKETWERLLTENKLGALALLRNLRNMKDVKANPLLIKAALERIKVERVLPFRFITAARYAPELEPELEKAMFKCIETKEKLSGKTVLLVDVSSSMEGKISSKSEISCLDAACGVGMLLREMCEDITVVTFSYDCKLVPARRGFALRDAITNSQPHGGTNLGAAVNEINRVYEYDRLIVITDEQSHDRVNNPKKEGYMINISTNKNGVGYGKWTHIDGFSEAVIDYIKTYEQSNLGGQDE